MKIQRKPASESFDGAYRRYMGSKYWAKRRGWCLKRDGERCRGCDATRDLHCAHRTYLRFKHERQDDLLTLCDRCHAWYDDERTTMTKEQKDAYLLRHPYLTVGFIGIENDRELLRAEEARIASRIESAERFSALRVPSETITVGA